MSHQEAKENIGSKVTYDEKNSAFPNRGSGVIQSANDIYVFVQFEKQYIACYAEDILLEV